MYLRIQQGKFENLGCNSDMTIIVNEADNTKLHFYQLPILFGKNVFDPNQVKKRFNTSLSDILPLMGGQFLLVRKERDCS